MVSSTAEFVLAMTAPPEMVTVIEEDGSVSDADTLLLSVYVHSSSMNIPSHDAVRPKPSPTRGRLTRSRYSWRDTAAIAASSVLMVPMRVLQSLL